MRVIFILLFIILISIPAYAKDDKDYESFQNGLKDWLAEDIKKTDYAALLKPISFFILEENMPEVEAFNYYNHITVYKVIETYKGKLPEYILFKGYSEYFKKYEGERYGILNEGTKIRAFCKGKNHYYLYSIPILYKDTPLLRKIAAQSALEKESDRNVCNEEHWLSK